MKNPLQDIRIPNKLLLICLSFSLPIAVLFVLTITAANKDIAFARKESLGVEYLRPLAELLHQVARHALAVQRASGGDSGLAPQVSELHSQMDRLFERLEPVAHSSSAKPSYKRRVSRGPRWNQPAAVISSLISAHLFVLPPILGEARRRFVAVPQAA